MAFFFIENKLSVINYSRTLYTSRKINYSAKLNEILSQELSSRIIMYSYNDDYSDENNSDNYEDLGKFLHFIFSIFLSFFF